MKTYLVTGASGRVGTVLTHQLLESGHRVIGLDLKNNELKNTHYTHIKTDFSDINVLRTALLNVDIVLHIGAFMSWRAEDNNAMYQANVTATQMLLEAASQHGSIERFVFASTGEVYPETNAKFLPITEDHPRDPTSFYGLTKKLGEDLVAFYQRQGLETCVLRFPHTQSADELLDPQSFFSGARFFLSGKIKQLEHFGKQDIAEKLKPLLQQGEQVIIQHGEEDNKPYMMHISDVRDTAAGVLLAATHSNAANQTFNLEPDDVVEFDKDVPQIAEKLGLPITNIYMPGTAIRYTTSNTKIKQLLGYQPRYNFRAMIQESASKEKR
ncbi:NAD-dependent epimerase/dehydratase family protein [Vibrio penaeicida]|uniref:NAD-dependent epimerase/dehydratase family protein n=1 Tax=Vibrio penaeicida TaxID=104609 RepID=UPI000CEA3E6E|nr:NAD(P)-dependent oxidoreductase [Vibrio penaeicida]